MRRAPWVLLLLGCGAASSGAAASPDCEPARERAGAAWSRVAELAEPDADAEEADAETPIDGATARLGAHLAALRESPAEVDGETAMEISGAVMDALDALGPDVPSTLSARVDAAAEALLTDRDAAGSQRAARDAITGLEAALAAARPEDSAGRESARAVAILARRAHDAATGYAEDVRIGDRRADRAEAASVPDSDAELSLARADAVDASRAAREACGFARTLSAPSL